MSIIRVAIKDSSFNRKAQTRTHFSESHLSDYKPRQRLLTFLLIQNIEKQVQNCGLRRNLRIILKDFENM